METKKNIAHESVKTITLTGLMTAVTCILAPMSIAIGPIPISFTNLAIYFGLYVIGIKKETLSVIIYLLIGMAGLPVFSGFTGGVHKLLGPTGGYLIGFIPMAIIAGIFMEKFRYGMVASIIGMILGTAACYFFGTLWLAFQADIPFKAALMTGVIPFIAGDLIKIIFAAIAASQIRKRLMKIKEN